MARCFWGLRNRRWNQERDDDDDDDKKTGDGNNGPVHSRPQIK
jgi:hypothetical protein